MASVFDYIFVLLSAKWTILVHRLLGFVWRQQNNRKRVESYNWNRP